MTETTGTPMPEMPTAATLGALLRQAREQQGYSLGEVAERLKFPARQVEALEAGVYEGLPEPVFIKGFLRSYARLLGVDEAQLNEQMKAIFPTDAAAVQAAQVMTKSTLDYRGMKKKNRFRAGYLAWWRWRCWVRPFMPGKANPVPIICVKPSRPAKWWPIRLPCPV